MTPERWRIVEDLFEAAAALPESERAGFLEAESHGDRALRDEVCSLLDHSGHSRDIGGVVQEVAQAFSTAEAASLSGRRAGAYRLTHPIGRGGAGVVYAAVRDDDQFSKQVAVKLIKRGMDSEFLLRRFRAERQILAGLEHPGIARLIDGGATEDGQPYFVMEQVEGLPITRHCEARQLSLEERLRLFRLVCDAVHYAHRHLVIHRDIKPGNILVSGEGQPKLLDFGLAKVLSESPAAPAVRMMTPDYASPEQVRGLPETTSTDVYSLGVVLYEILTGERPHRLTDYTPEEIELRICQTPIAPPSTVAHALLRAASTLVSTPVPPGFRLVGDLDSIVVKAMHKEPERRYSSVEQLSQDIDHYLHGRPVSARPNTIAYRARKFAGRYKLPVAAAALAFAGIATAGIFAAGQAQRAERRFQEVRKLAHVFIFDLNNRLERTGSIETRRFVLKTGLDYLTNLEREARGDVPLLVEVAQAYTKLGNVQGNPRGPNLGDSAGAMASYRRAAGILESLSVRLDREGRLALARAYINIGFLHSSHGEWRDAVATFRKCQPIAEALSSGGADTAGLEINGQVHLGTARALAQLDDNAGVAAHAAQALAVHEKLVAIAPTSFNNQTFLASSHITLGTALANSGRRSEALAHFQDAAGIRERLVAREPDSRQAKLNLLDTYGTVGDHLCSELNESPDCVGALSYYRKTLALAEGLARQDASDKKARAVLAMAEEQVGAALRALSRFEEALGYLRRAAAATSELAAVDPANYNVHAFKLAAEREIAHALLTQGKPAEAREHSGAAVAAAESLLRSPGGTGPAGSAMEAYAVHVRVLGRLGDRAGVKDASGRILDLAGKVHATTPSGGSHLAAEAFAAAGEAHQALARPADLEDVCTWFGRSVERWDRIRAAGFTGGILNSGPVEANRQLTRCRTELARTAHHK